MMNPNDELMVHVANCKRACAAVNELTALVEATKAKLAKAEAYLETATDARNVAEAEMRHHMRTTVYKW